MVLDIQRKVTVVAFHKVRSGLGDGVIYQACTCSDLMVFRKYAYRSEPERWPY